MRFQGKLTNWNDAKGIGTIVWNGSSDRVFVHISAFKTRHKRPEEGDIVVYEVEKDKNGKFRAINVAFAQGQPGSVVERPTSSSGIFIGSITVLFLAYFLFCIFKGRAELIVLGIYAAASSLTFIIYIADKIAARKGNQRTPENTLHMMALLCGWPGAYAAQRMMRHKTAKKSFQAVFVITVALNIMGFIVYSSPTLSRAIFGQ
jgi:uncharacterized membrane protein YsdA (DUF1294 family)/cold shock CspA family protein